MTNPAPFIVAGLVNGSIYGVAAMGTVFTYRVSRVVNFAYGAIAMFCSYSFWQMHVEWGWPTWVAFIVAVLVLPTVLAVLSERFVYRSLSDMSDFAKTAASIGVLLAFYGLSLYIWNERIVTGKLNPVSVFPNKFWKWPGVFVSANQIGVIVSTMLTLAVVFGFLRFTKAGLALRAVVSNRNLAQLRRLNAQKITRRAWIFSYVISGLAGVLLAGIIGNDPTTLTIIVVYSLTAATLGGLNSLPLAVLGGLLLGLTDAFALGYLPLSEFWQRTRLLLPFVFFLVSLLVIGKRVAARPQQLNRTALLHDLGPAALQRRPRPKAVIGLAALVLAIAYILRWTGEGYAVGVLSSGSAIAVVYLGVRVFSATTGMVSLALAAFAGAGGMAAAGLRGPGGFPWPLAVLGGGVAAMVLGAIVALPTVRLRGIFLTLATLAFAQLVEKALFTNKWFSGGDFGREFPRPTMIKTDMAFLIAVLVIFVVIAYLCELFQFSTIGRELQADLGSSQAARAIGLRPEVGRLIAFMISSAVIGIGGALMATGIQRATPSGFGFVTTFTWLSIVAAAGLGSSALMLQQGVLAGVIAELVSVHFPEAERGYVAIFGFLALALLRTPGGLAAMQGRFHEKMMTKLARKAPAAVASPVGH